MRFYVPNIKDGSCLELTGEPHTHAAYALRIRIGDYLTVFDGNGTDYACQVKDIKKDKTLLEVQAISNDVGEPKLDVSLYLSVIKQDRFEIAVQKATELGVRRIVPVYSQHTQRGNSLNYERLNKIAVAACEQCGRSRLPMIENSIEFDELLKRTASTYMIFPWERELHGSLKSAIDKKKNNASVFIGPEGGITEDEKNKLVESGAHSVTLGARILRAETAAIATLSVLYYEMGEWCL